MTHEVYLDITRIVGLLLLHNETEPDSFVHFTVIQSLLLPTTFHHSSFNYCMSRYLLLPFINESFSSFSAFLTLQAETLFFVSSDRMEMTLRDN